MGISGEGRSLKGTYLSQCMRHTYLCDLASPVGRLKHLDFVLKFIPGDKYFEGYIYVHYNIALFD